MTDRPRLPWSGKAILAVAVLFLLGLGERTICLDLAPKWAYPWDHFDNMAMGLTADRFGLTKAYTVPVGSNPTVHGPVFTPKTGHWQNIPRQMPRVSNYPPIGLTLFYLQAKSYFALWPGSEINTFGARLWMALLPVAAELLLAAGVYLFGRRLGGARTGGVAAAVCWLFPPLAMDSSFWGQTDAWFLAPAVWFLLLLLKERWLAAGLIWGLAISLKPQGILLVPVALFAAVLLPIPPETGLPAAGARRLGKTVGAAAVTLALLTLPWTITDGFAWYREAFQASLQMYERTTMRAFNLWYIDALRLDTNPTFNILDSTVRVLGLSRDRWGSVLLAMSAAGAAVLCWRKYRRRPELGLILFTALWLWSVFFLPTRVHQRYIAYCMPMAILAATMLKRLWPAVALLALVGAAEMSHNVWLRPPMAGEFQQEGAALFAREMNRRYEEVSRSLPPGRAGPPPTLSEATTAYRTEYLARRVPNRWREVLATAVSLLAFAWAWTAPFLTRFFLRKRGEPEPIP